MTAESAENRKLALDERRLAFEERKWEAEQAKQPESPWKSPLLIAILTAAAAAGGNAVVSRLNADAQLRVERLKGEQALITEMIKTDGDVGKTANNLRFLVDTGLISDPDRRAKLERYLNKVTPERLPSLASPSGTAAPLSTAARATGLAVGDGCRARGAKGELCVEKGILLRADGKPFEVVDVTQNKSPLRAAPVAVVAHYSSGRDGELKRMFKDPAAPGGAHLEINRDGSITQLVPFDIIANHAGASAWQDLKGLNGTTLGIMFANYGRLDGQPGAWRNLRGETVPDGQVLVVREADGRATGWERYTPAQLQAAEKVLRALKAAYPSLRAVLAHSAIAVPRGRKLDPGPALPIDRLNALVAGQ